MPEKGKSKDPRWLKQLEFEDQNLIHKYGRGPSDTRTIYEILYGDEIFDMKEQEKAEDLRRREELILAGYSGHGPWPKNYKPKTEDLDE